MISSKNSSIPVSCSVKALGFIKEIDSTSPFEKIQSSNYYQLLFLTRQSNYLKDPFKEIMHENSRSFSIYLKNEKSVVIQIDTLVPQHFGHLLVLRSLSVERVIRAVVLVSCSCYKELGIWNNLKEQIMNMKVVTASPGPCLRPGCFPFQVGAGVQKVPRKATTREVTSNGF